MQPLIDDLYRPIYDPRFLSEEQKIHGVLSLLRSMRMSALDVVTKILGSREEYKSWKNGMFQGKAFEYFFDAMDRDTRGRVMISKRMGASAMEDAVEAVVKLIAEEMSTMKSTMGMTSPELTPQFLYSFHLADLTEKFIQRAPVLSRILQAASRSPRSQIETNRDTSPITSIIHSQLCKIYGQRNQLCALPTGFFLVSCGIPRKVTDVLSQCGLCPSYDTLNSAREILADGMMEEAKIVSRGPHLVGWDNTNISTSIHVEQRDMAPPKVQSGTTAILYALRNATPDDVRLKPISERRTSLDMINFNSDIRPTRKQMQDMTTAFEIDVIKILLDGQKGFDYLQDEPELQHKKYRPPPSGYKTKEYVLRTTTIEENSTEGNIKVNENIYLDQCELKDNGIELEDTAVGSINDRDTNRLIRAAMVLRADDRTTVLRLAHLQLAPGMFHVLLNLLWAILKIHRGTDADDGSLQFYISLLTKSRLNSDHPDYNTTRSFFNQVLFGHIMLYWTTETGMSLVELANSKPTSLKLREYAARIISKHISTAALSSADHVNDGVKHATILLDRDLLTFYTLNLAIGSGDFGRVEIFLGTVTMMFSGAGCPQYTDEFLHFIQCLNKVWTPAFANVMRDNSLISTSGRENHYSGVDHNAEENIGFQKWFFQNKGRNASWKGLSDIAPIIPMLRHLKKQFTRFVGATYRGVTHTIPDTSSAVRKVTSKSKELNLNSIVPDREATFEPTDILLEGAINLSGAGIRNFQKRYKSWVISSTPYNMDII